MKYPEKFVVSPSKGGGILPRLIVLHHSSGSFGSAYNTIMNKADKVSYHYLIDYDGSRIQFVPDKAKAWHCGDSFWAGLSGLNAYSVGIAFWGDTYERVLSAAEIDSCAEKCWYLMKKFGIGYKAIITHGMIAPDRRDDCSLQTLKKVIEMIKIYEKNDI